jgi:ankyrin repeat protein
MSFIQKVQKASRFNNFKAKNTAARPANDVQQSNAQQQRTDAIPSQNFRETTPELPRDETNPIDFTAFQRGVASKVEDALKTNSKKIEGPDKNGLTVLMHTARLGQEEIVAKLLEKGARVFAQDNDGLTALHWAAREGQLGALQKLLENIPKLRGATATMLSGGTQARFPEDSSGLSPLLWAARQGHLEVCKCLLDYLFADLELKASIGKSDFFNQRKITHWAALGGHDEIIAYLQTWLKDKEQILNFEDTDRDGRTPLHLAAIGGHSYVIYLLLRAKVKFDEPDKFSRTALHYAAEGGYTPVVQQLLSHAESKSKQAMESLLEAPASDNNEAYKANKALWVAARAGHRNVVQLLIENGAKLAAEATEQSELQVAAENGHLDIVEFLIDKDAKVHYTDKNKYQALHYAAAGGHHDVVGHLLAKHAFINAKAKDELTPLMMAARQGHDQVVEKLLKHKDGELVEFSRDNGASDEGRCHGVFYYLARGHEAEINQLSTKNRSGGDKSTMLESLTRIFWEPEEKYQRTAFLLVCALFEKEGSEAEEGDKIKLLLEILDKKEAPGRGDALAQIALRSAIKSKAKDAVKALLDWNVDRNVRDVKLRQKVLHVAAAATTEGVEHNVDKNVQDIVKQQEALREIMKLLVQKVTDPKPQDGVGTQSTQQSSNPVSQKDTQLESKDLEGRTLLHLAVEANNEKVVEWLLDEGVEINPQKIDGKTPLQIADAKDDTWTKIKNLLRKRGAKE